MVSGTAERAPSRRLRLGMIGGGRGAFIGAVHRLAARMDDRWDFVAGALSSDPQKALASAADLRLDPTRAYPSWQAMLEGEAKLRDGGGPAIDAVAIVTPNHVHHGPAKAFLESGFHVICDKPMTTTVADAEDLVAAVQKSGQIFALTHNYTGYPMIRQARAMVAEGALGKIRLVEAEYAQDWLATKAEDTGSKQAEWRVDPARSGPAGCVGDIGTHAYNLANFVTGEAAQSLAADLQSFVPGRRLDDNAHILLRYASGARGMVWASQVASGNENGLRLRVYGEKAGLEWAQENPNYLIFMPLGEPHRRLTRGGPGSGPAAAHATRVPPGHPEGYLECFAQIYSDAAEQILARLETRDPAPDALLVPTVADGLAGVRFIAACVASSQNDAAWTKI